MRRCHSLRSKGVAADRGAAVMGDVLGFAEARARLEQCRAIVGGKHDRMRGVWDAAGVKDRRLLLAMGGNNSVIGARVASRDWVDLSPEVRQSVSDGMRRWLRWAEVVGAW